MTTEGPFDFSVIIWLTESSSTTFTTSTYKYDPFSFSDPEPTSTSTSDPNYELGHSSSGGNPTSSDFNTIDYPTPTVSSVSNTNTESNDPPTPPSTLPTSTKLAITLGTLFLLLTTSLTIYSFLRWQRWLKQRRAKAGSWGGEVVVSKGDTMGAHVEFDRDVDLGFDVGVGVDENMNEKRVVRSWTRERRGRGRGRRESLPLPPPTYEQAVGGSGET